ncbi:hypothetical protein ACGFT2_06315 [Streptomyces sp. NPDC048514]|uniref:hypothetical protein n=1 Tax=Streptomyces sp. NPDC048514 TaxID=3365564 RepID=UPI00371253DE
MGVVDPWPWAQRFFDEGEHIFTYHGLKCITGKGNSVDNGAWLTLWTCGSAYNTPQSWKMVG